MPPAVELREITKVYPGGIEALRGISLDIHPGEVLGLLGPNGAGKTTLVRILTTLARATSGTASVAGFDVQKQPEKARRRIGYVGQTAALDLLATGKENLFFLGRLLGLRGSKLERRIHDLIAAFQLADVAERLVQTYSGGMRRRLDLATGLIHRPAVLFLDEPTTGLDPESRYIVWDQIRNLASQEGMTILLTTHYMDEADALAGRLAILDRGCIVVTGTPGELKSGLQGDVVTVEFASRREADAARDLLQGLDGVTRVIADAMTLSAQVPDGSVAVPRIVGALRERRIPLGRVSLQRPTLDEVYFSATGRKDRPAIARSQLFPR